MRFPDELVYQSISLKQDLRFEKCWVLGSDLLAKFSIACETCSKAM